MAFNEYFTTVAEYNRAQFELFHALGYPAREVACSGPPARSCRWTRRGRPTCPRWATGRPRQPDDSRFFRDGCRSSSLRGRVVLDGRRQHAELYVRLQYIYRNSPMISHMRGGGRLPLKAFALFAGVLGSSPSRSAMADDNGPWSRTRSKTIPRPYTGHHHHSTAPELRHPGLRPSRPLPGLSGLWSRVPSRLRLRRRRPGRRRRRRLSLLRRPRLSPRRPRLRRIGGITPFPYYGGPGYPTPDHPNFFGGVGPLVPDQPVVTIATDRGDPVDATDYGPFTGSVPMPRHGSPRSRPSRGRCAS